MTRQRLIWLATALGLYAASGWPFGLINKLVALWLTSENTSLEKIGLISLIGLPWTFKVFWAPLVDRHGSAGGWIAGALGVVGICTYALPQFGHTSPWFWVLLLTMATASATQDIVIDGYAATTTPKDLLGRLSGVRVGAYRAAMLTAGGGLAWFSDRLSWAQIFGIGATICVIGSIFALFLPSVPRKATPWREWTQALWGWLRGDGWVRTGLLILFILSFKLGDATMGPMVEPFWKHAGLSMQDISLISVILGAVFTIVGAIIGGEITNRIGTFHALWSLGLFQALSNLGYAWVALSPSREGIFVASFFESFSSGLGTAAFLAALAHATKGEQAATRFAMLTALAGFTRSIAGSTSGFIASYTDYSVFFTLTFIIALPAFALLPGLRSRLEAR